MFSKRFWGRWVGVLSLCCLLMGSCTYRPDTAANSQRSPARILIGTTANAPTLDPADAYGIWNGNLLYNLGDRLYRYSDDGTTLTPQLATALPSLSQDGLTYQIPLRQGVTFHDGAAFNAAAMAFSLQRFISNGGQPAFLLGDVVDTVKATGEYELTIHLKQPFVMFPHLLAFYGTCAVSPKFYEIGENKFKPDQFVGTGPYKLTSLRPDSLHLDAFEQYWGEKPANKGIDIQRFSSTATLFNAFRTGAVDVAYQQLDLQQILSLQQGAAQKGWQVIEAIGTGIYYLSVNLQSPPLDQLPVRQALAAIIDRPLLQQRVFRGQIQPLYSLIPTAFKVSRPVFQERYGDANAAQAVALLRQAGYSKAKPAIVELWYRSNLTSNQLAAMTLKAAAEKQLEGLLQFELKSVESTTAYRNLDKGAYPTFILDWSADFIDPDNYIQPFMDCTKGSEAKGCEDGSSKGQGSFYYRDRVNQLIQQQRQEKDAILRDRLFGELQNILAEDVPFIPLWQNKEYLFVRSGITGAQIISTQKIVPFYGLHRSGV